MSEQEYVAKEFNDANIRVAREFKAQRDTAIGAIIKIAAECHRAKWQFNLGEDYKPVARVARDLIGKAFAELHRIGDMAIKAKEALAAPVPNVQPEVQNNDQS